MMSPCRRNIEAIECANRGFGLAGSGAKGGEVVAAEQASGGLVHGGGVERGGDMPDPPASRAGRLRRLRIR